MTLKKAFIYTTVVFTFLSLGSTLGMAQQRKLSMKEALSLALSNNRELKITSLDVDRSKQQILVAKSGALPNAGINGQLAHYFKEPAFFGFGGNPNSGDKISYGRFGGKDQAMATLYVEQP